MDKAKEAKALPRLLPLLLLFPAWALTLAPAPATYLGHVLELAAEGVMLSWLARKARALVGTRNLL